MNPSRRKPLGVIAPGALALVILAGCASVPAGPTWSALPGSARTTAQFEVDDVQCRAQTAAQASASQQRYDQLYYSCMYAQSHRVPAPSGAPAGGWPPAGSVPSAGPGASAGSSTSSGAASSRPPPPAPPPGAPPAPPRSWLRG